MKLIEDTEILGRFVERLESSNRIDIASAWASNMDALRALEKVCREREFGVRAMVGTNGKTTDPDALKKLNKIGELRLISGTHRLFHAKVYVFYGKDKSFAWIGSANFTQKGGFSRQFQIGSRQNEETLFETETWEEVASWFEKRWANCPPLHSTEIEEYSEKHSNEEADDDILKGRDASVAKVRLNLVRNAKDWNGYIRALKACNDNWLANRKCKFSVLGKERSWAHTIRAIQIIARDPNWPDLVKHKREMLLSQTEESDSGNWALLGRLRSPQIARMNRDKKLLNEIGSNVAQVANAKTVDDREFLRIVHTALSKIYRPHIKKAVATRFLALARPDKCVSVNGACEKGLKDLFPNIPKMGSPDGYCRLLEEIYKQPWYNVPSPEDEYEKELWQMRAALLDCFVYLPRGASTRHKR